MDLLPSRHVSVGDFVREALTLAGAEWDEPEPDIVEALLPDSGDLRRATFEPEIAREEKGTEIAAHGSPFVEDLARLGLSRGRLGRVYLSPPPSPPPGLARAYDLRALKVSRGDWSPRSWTTWVFAFGSHIVGEFRRDSIHFCAIDGASLRIVRRFEEAFARFPPGDTGPPPAGDRGFEECYAAGRKEALQAAEISFRTALRQAGEDLAHDLARLGRYYDGLIEEMNADMDRTEAQDPRRTSILSRMQATRVERDRAAAQARERHALSLEVEVLGALGVVYPRQTAVLTLGEGNARGTSVEAVWDPIRDQFEALGCPACGRPSYSLQLTGRTVNCGCARPGGGRHPT